jgi:ficolin
MAWHGAWRSSWRRYRDGFGSMKGEFWLGLEKINRLSRTMPHRLRIDLTSFDGAHKYGTWNTVGVRPSGAGVGAGSDGAGRE